MAGLAADSRTHHDPWAAAAFRGQNYARRSPRFFMRNQASSAWTVLGAMTQGRVRWRKQRGVSARFTGLS